MIWSRKFGAWTFEAHVTGGVLLGFTIFPGPGNWKIISLSLLVVTLVLWREGSIDDEDRLAVTG